jgi:hypothetical protein
MAGSALDAVWKDATRGESRGGGATVAPALSALAASALWLTMRPGGFEQPREAVRAVLDVPLALAACALVAALAWLARPASERARALVVLATAGATLTWAAWMGFDYDARWSRLVRADNLRHALDVATHVPPHSLLFAQWPDWHGTVPALVEDVYVAYPAVDDFRDFRRLATHHLDGGRRVFLALDPPTLNTLEQDGALAGFEFRRVGGTREAVIELRRAPR